MGLVRDTCLGRARHKHVSRTNPMQGRDFLPPGFQPVLMLDVLAQGMADDAKGLIKEVVFHASLLCSEGASRVEPCRRVSPGDTPSPAVAASGTKRVTTSFTSVRNEADRVRPM